MEPNEGNGVHPLVRMRGVLLETSGQRGALCTPSSASFSHFTTAEQGKSGFYHLNSSGREKKQWHLPSSTPSSANGLILNFPWLMSALLQERFLL